MVLISYLGVAITIVGVVLLLFGLCPRRVGDSPYCWHCRYNLTGIESTCCPECGHSIDDGSIIYGERKRHPRLIVIGILSLIPISIAGIGSLANITVYSFVPTGYVIDDLTSVSEITSKKAGDELLRRIRSDKIDSRHHTQLIDICLDMMENAHDPESIGEQYAANILGDVFVKGFMTQQQADSFFELCFYPKLKVRPRVIIGDTVPLDVSLQAKVPGAFWWSDCSENAIKVDGHEVHAVGRSLFASYGIETHFNARMPAAYTAKPGTYDVGVAATICVYIGKQRDASSSTLQHQRSIELKAKVEVLETEPDDYLIMTSDSVSAGTLRNSFTIDDFPDNTIDPDNSITGTITIEFLPVNVSFDIIMRIQGEEYIAGSICQKKTLYNVITLEHYNWPKNVSVVESFDLILRSNPKHLRDSVDMFEAWDGELVYKEIPVAIK